jgi:hypothetical protein
VTAMDIEIQDVTGAVRAVDSSVLLNPRTVEAIVAAVLAALDRKKRNDEQARADTRVTQGVAAEQEQGA